MTPNTVYGICIVFCIVIVLYILHILYIYVFMTYSISHSYFGKLLDPWNVCIYVCMCMYDLLGRRYEMKTPLWTVISTYEGSP